MNPNSLLFSQRERGRERERERERESSKSSREGDGVMVLGKFSVLRRPTNLENSRARDYCACSRCGRGLFVLFFSRLSFFFSFSLFWRRPDID